MSACGKTTWYIACTYDIPFERAASICPVSTAFSPERKISEHIADSNTVKAVIAAGMISSLIPNVGSPKYVKKIISKSGKFLIISMKKPTIAERYLILLKRVTPRIAPRMKLRIIEITETSMVTNKP